MTDLVIILVYLAMMLIWIFKKIKFRSLVFSTTIRIIIIKFISRKRMIDIIEKTLQKFSDIFANGYKIDIKGNEEDGEN